MNLWDAVDKFLVAIEADGVSKSTIGWYKSMLKTFEIWIGGDTPLSDISTDKVREYIVFCRRTMNDSTSNGQIRIQHRFWSWVSLEWGMTNPMRNIKYPSPPKNTAPKAVLVDDMSRLFDVIPESYEGFRNKAVLCVLIDTTARAGELCNIRIENVDMVNRVLVTTGKTGMRRLGFTKYTGDVLQKWLDVRSPLSTWLFYNVRTLAPLTPSGVYQLCKRIKGQAGVQGRANPHAFRHAFAREYLKAGGDLATLSQIMGHADVSTTAQSYAIFLEDELNEKHEAYSPIHHLTGDKDRD